MCVQGIPERTTPADLRHIFEAYGVASVAIWRPDGYFVGYAFVNFSTAEDAQKAYVDGCLKPFSICGEEVAVTASGWPTKHLRPPSDQLRVEYTPRNVTQYDLQSLFRQYGTVKAAIESYALTGKRRGVAHVHFESKEVTTRIMEAHKDEPFTIGTCRLDISYAQPFLPSLVKRGHSWQKQFKETFWRNDVTRGF